MHNHKPNDAVGYHRHNPGAHVLISLSVINIFLWLLCTTFSVSFVLNNAVMPNSLIRFASLDLISPGVWGSLFYGLGGLLGICAAYERRQPILVGTLVLAMLSIFSSLGIAAVSGAMAVSPRFRSYNNAIWLGLEWTLLILSILGFIVNLSVFVSVSVLICRPQTRFPAYCFILLQYHHRQPLPPAPPPPNCNNSIHNANYVGAAEMANMTLVPPPPPGFVVNPPVASHQRQQQTRHQQNFNSSPLPHGLIASETNF